MLKNKTILVFLGVITLASLETQAGLIKNIRLGMGAAGFSQTLARDGLSQGWDYGFSQTFNDKIYNFGTTQLTLNGALQGKLLLGTRGIPQAELILTPTTIGYDYTFFDGVRKLQIENGLFSIANADIKINQYGAYDINLQITNEATLIGDGANPVSIPLSFEIGPINVHGQWLIDLINLTLGKQFGFTLPGGAADQIVSDLNQQFDQQMKQAVASYYDQADAPAGLTLSPVPEPASLLFLALGTTLVFRRRK
ncbi:MAG: PEP-CTERM sorting domain-containing protein [Phycisphaerae bacterium]